MNTINVLELAGETNVLSLRSWEDNPDGNTQAEAHFLQRMAENPDDPQEGTPTAQACLEDGLYECGDYKLFLIHSTGGTKGAV